MIQNPIRKVLSTLSTHNVRCLLMGGQACILYGAAEFSRDTDIVLLADEENIQRLQAGLEELMATVIAVPPLDLSYLNMGHAVHFRCKHPEAQNIRLDVMSVVRGLDAFSELWARRSTLELDGESIEVLSLPDLVKAKKTQRDKDWPMIRRLIEADYEQRKAVAPPETIRFWLLESRTPAMLKTLYADHAESARKLIHDRALLKLLPDADEESLEQALRKEEWAERKVDRAYWEPLLQELERLRHPR